MPAPGTEARSLADVIPLTPESLTVLGTDAAGDMAIAIDPSAMAVETERRADKACALAAAALQLVKRPPPAGGKQAERHVDMFIALFPR